MDNERLKQVAGIRVVGFDWDDGNRQKCAKHGVPTAEIEWIFANSPRFAPDEPHSSIEDRFVAVGRNSAGRPLFVAFTLRRSDAGMLIRPVSARYMHAREIVRYEESAETKDG